MAMGNRKQAPRESAHIPIRPGSLLEGPEDLARKVHPHNDQPGALQLRKDHCREIWFRLIGDGRRDGV